MRADGQLFIEENAHKAVQGIDRLLDIDHELGLGFDSTDVDILKEALALLEDIERTDYTT